MPDNQNCVQVTIEVFQDGYHQSNSDQFSVHPNGDVQEAMGRATAMALRAALNTRRTGGVDEFWYGFLRDMKDNDKTGGAWVSRLYNKVAEYMESEPDDSAPSFDSWMDEIVA